MRFFPFRFTPLCILMGTAALLLSSCFTHRPWMAEAEKAQVEGRLVADPETVGPELLQNNAEWDALMDPKEGTVHRVFLIGDGGKWPNSKAPLEGLRDMLPGFPDAQTSIIWLGDNIYPVGLRPKGHPGRPTDEAVLANQLKVLEDFEGLLLYIPGNHDWQQGGSDGLSHVQRQDKWFDKHRDGNVLRPDKGCPGPEVIEVAPGVVLILIDTQWWLHQYNHPDGVRKGCSIDDMAEWMDEMDAVLLEHYDDAVIVAGHHPLYSNGEHGGYFPWDVHLFPLRELNHSLWVPLPVIGSLLPLYRSTSGDIQDIPHPHYQAMRDALTSSFAKHPHVVYACGHEHNLQLHERDGVHYIVSGSGAKHSALRKGKGAEFLYPDQGFAVLDIRADGGRHLVYYGLSPEGGVVPVFETELPNGRGSKEDERPETGVKAALSGEGLVPGSMVEVAAGADYGASRFKGWFFGQHYRDAWTAPIEAPVLDVSTEKGGMIPLRQGGGQQTLSLRLAAEDGHTYVWRSVNKDPAKALPRSLRNTIAADVLQDQISSAHPYGALVVPPLATAAGIQHKRPSVGVVPWDTALGPYRDRFAGQLVLMEERAGKNLEAFPHLAAGAERADNTIEVLANLEADNEHRVDEANFLRHRLFDMFLGDWDRHEDQWRWARFDNEDGGYTYKPVPRDRDQVFARFDGLFPWFASRKWAIRKFQHFGDDIRDISGMNFNARYLDRSFLTESERADWVAAAEELQAALTDRVIEEAFKAWPDTIFALDGERTIGHLKSRRDKLVEFAERYYDVLAREVDVLGSDQEELFKVERVGGGATRVRIYNLKKKGKKGRLLYDRTFHKGETREVRLYGRGGDDQFDVKGEDASAVLVRIIGGGGDDEVDDRSRVRGPSKCTKVYDKPKGMDVDSEGEVRKHLTRNDSINVYNRRAFVYNLLAPALDIGYNPEDGVFLGLGFNRITYGFRKDPFRAQHKLSGNISPTTGAFNVRYAFDFPQIFGKWGLAAKSGFQGPDARSNFFGVGNTTVEVSDNTVPFHRLRFDRAFVSPRLRGRLSDKLTLDIGVDAEYLDLESDSGRITGSPEGGFQAEELDPYALIGGSVSLEFRKVIGTTVPEKGVVFRLGGSGHQSVYGFDRRFGRMESSLIWYLPIFRGFTWANRVGGTVLTGDPDILHMATLGSTDPDQSGGVLRGLPRDRYSGLANVYVNSSLRLRVARYRTSLVSGDVGISGFFDQGRVWGRAFGVSGGIVGLDQDADQWHYGYGGGVWLTALDALVVQVQYARSRYGDQTVLGGLGFPF